MYYTRHERNMQDAFYNFLQMGSYAYLHAATRHLVSMDHSFGDRRRRAYLLQIHLSGLPKENELCKAGYDEALHEKYMPSRTLRLNQRFPSAKGCFSALVRKLFVCGDIPETRYHYTNEHPALQNPVRRGVRFIVVWWDYLGSNRRPLRCERSALTN